MLERMIMTHTPLRITLVDRGTDMPVYYGNKGHCAVVSEAINKYIQVSFSVKFDRSIRASHSKTEMVDSEGRIEQPSVKEEMRFGSSGTFTVRLLHSFNGKLIGTDQFVRETVTIEREIQTERKGKPIPLGNSRSAVGAWASVESDFTPIVLEVHVPNMICYPLEEMMA